MPFKNILFIPVYARSLDDIALSKELAESAEQAGYDPGFMLVIKDGPADFRANQAEQYAHLAPLADWYGDKPIITMMANFPLEQTDFLHSTTTAENYVKAGVDFAKGLPIGKRRIVTFHLLAVMSEAEYHSADNEAWLGQFGAVIVPSLKRLADYAQTNGVELKIETEPAPVFGDVAPADERVYRGTKLRELLTPFIQTNLWGFTEIRQTGVGICLDICHARTIYEIAKQNDLDAILPASQRTALKGRNLMDDVQALTSTDLIHINDGSGMYSRSGQSFHEGLPLGEGEIKELGIIIDQANKAGIPMVLEVWDQDFAKRDETKRSIAYLNS